MNDTPASLYTTWFETLPGFFRAMLPPDSANAPSPATASDQQTSPPFPADQVGKALNAMNGILPQLYQSYLPLLAQGGFSAEALKGFANAGTDTFKRLREALAMPGSALPDLQAWNGYAQLAQPWNLWLSSLTAGEHPDGQGPHLLQVGMDRTFGGLSDAFGLGPMRQLDQAWREMFSAGIAKQRAQLEYLAVVTEAWNEGTQRLVQELSAMGKRGERIESLLAFIRLWAKAVDGAMHEAMQSERGLAATTKVMRAATSYRQQLQKAVGLASESLHMPTRADVDEAYREIQELKRELRRIKKSLPPAVQQKTKRVKESKA